MSKSYKKHPYSGMPNDQFYKGYANRRIRRLKPQASDDWHDPLPGYGGYRKHSCPWNISDFGWVAPSLKVYIHNNQWRLYSKYYNLKDNAEIINEYHKEYTRK